MTSSKKESFEEPHPPLSFSWGHLPLDKGRKLIAKVPCQGDLGVFQRILKFDLKLIFVIAFLNLLINYNVFATRFNVNSYYASSFFVEDKHVFKEFPGATIFLSSDFLRQMQNSQNEADFIEFYEGVPYLMSEPGWTGLTRFPGLIYSSRLDHD